MYRPPRASDPAAGPGPAFRHAKSGEPMAQDFSPTEIFKRATAATLRAIAERDDLTVGFGPEPPG